jgi:predicted  nucleic acid-binding Zn-ribbon protein
MKNNFLATALKALKKQRNVYQTDRDRYEVAERTAKENKQNCESELVKLDKQIEELEKQIPKKAEQKELSLT